MMIKAFAAGLRQALIFPVTLLAMGIGTTSSAVAQTKLYNPISLPGSNQVSDTLSGKDIPTGEGGFARDYLVKFNKGDNVAIDLTSDSFDSMVALMAPDGSTIAENDDGPDGSTNSLLFTRITEAGTYIVRVRSFGETGVGAFKLRVTRLRPL
jgi:hypothetical protein